MHDVGLAYSSVSSPLLHGPQNAVYPTLEAVDPRSGKMATIIFEDFLYPDPLKPSIHIRKLANKKQLKSARLDCITSASPAKW